MEPPPPTFQEYVTDPPATMMDKYEFQEFIADGSSCMVFKGNLKSDINDQVAVKVINLLKLDQLQRYLQDREIEILKDVQGHKNIIKLYDCYHHGNMRFIVTELLFERMPFVEGPDLNYNIINKKFKFPHEHNDMVLAKNFIRGLLVDQSERFNEFEALGHSWLREYSM
eukprot:gene14565-17215_t